MEKVLRRYFNGDRGWLYQNDDSGWTNIAVNIDRRLIYYFPIYRQFPAIEIKIENERQAMKLLFLLGAFGE